MIDILLDLLSFFSPEYLHIAVCSKSKVLIQPIYEQDFHNIEISQMIP